MSKDRDGQIVTNPIFPDVMVSTATGSNDKGEGEQTVIVITLSQAGKPDINAMISLKMAVSMGKSLMGAALSEMDPDEIEDLEDLTVFQGNVIGTA